VHIRWLDALRPILPSLVHKVDRFMNEG